MPGVTRSVLHQKMKALCHHITPCDTKNKFRHLTRPKKSCSTVYALVFLMSSSLALFVVFVCDHTRVYSAVVRILLFIGFSSK